MRGYQNPENLFPVQTGPETARNSLLYHLTTDRLSRFPRPLPRGWRVFGLGIEANIRKAIASLNQGNSSSASPIREPVLLLSRCQSSLAMPDSSPLASWASYSCSRRLASTKRASDLRTRASP